MKSAHQALDEPARLLVDSLDLLPRGKALDIAAGRGRHALYLAARGFEVDALERDAEAVSYCQSIAREHRLRVQARQMDLERCTLAPSLYHLVVCFYYLQRDLIPQMIQALKPGGMVIYETFLIDNHTRSGHPRNRAYCFEHNELLGFFKDLRVLFYREGTVEGPTFVAQIIAQKNPS